MPPERVQKLLSAAGLGSRRACEQLIAAGRVRVNGRVASLGDKADPSHDGITLDGEEVVLERHVYIMLHKPRGAVSSLKPQGDRPTVRDLVDAPGRLYPVGRLDVDSEGLILLTNDGALTNRMTHPRYGLEKEYLLLVDGYPKDDVLDVWRRGVVLDDGTRTAPAVVSFVRKGAAGTWLRVVIREGRKRQIRRVAQTLGLGVKRLQRVRIGALRLGALKVGEWRELSQAEVNALRASKASGGQMRKTGRRR